MRKKIVLTSVLVGAAALALSLGGAVTAQAAPGEPTATAKGVQAAWSFSQDRLYVQDTKADGLSVCATLEQWRKQSNGKWDWVSIISVHDRNGANGDSPSIAPYPWALEHSKDKGNFRITVRAYSGTLLSNYCSSPSGGGKSVEFRAY